MSNRANPLTNRDEFLRWRDNQLTQAYHQFLMDRVQALSLAWAQRSVPSDHPAMVASQVQAETLGDLAALEHSDVRDFYGLSEGETE